MGAAHSTPRLLHQLLGTLNPILLYCQFICNLSNGTNGTAHSHSMSCVKVPTVSCPTSTSALTSHRFSISPPFSALSLPFLAPELPSFYHLACHPYSHHQGSRVLIYLRTFQPYSQKSTNFAPVPMNYGRNQWSPPLRPSLSNPITSTSYASTPYDSRPRDAARGVSEILPCLYISDLSFAENPASLSSYRITHVLSTLPDKIHIPSVHPPPSRLQIKVEDFPFAELAAHLPTTTAWIRDALKSSPNARVLVHCGEGISRSVSVVAAFLIATYGWTPVEALQYIKSKRKVANPNFGFVQQLGEYARSLPNWKS